MAKNDIGGVWRTIGGRKVFIKDGQDLASAMKESGKFKSANKISKKDEDDIKKSMHKVAEQYEQDKKEGKVAERLKENEANERKIRSEAIGKTENEKRFDKISEGAEERAMQERYDKAHGVDTESQEYLDSVYEEAHSKNNKFEVSELKKKALEALPKEDIDTHEGDLYIKKTKESTELLNNMKDKDNGMLTTFKDQQTGETWYDVPFANMEDDYKQKTTNDIMNEKIRSKGKAEFEEDLPKHTEIKIQGTSNRKEVSENIQAHILEHYDKPEDFIEQMDAYDWKPTMWHRGEALAEDGFYEIYYDDQRKFLDDLKINPKGKNFSDDRVFQTYKSLIGRESAKLYDRIQKNSYKKYLKAHPLSKMSFEEFKDMNKK